MLLKPSYIFDHPPEPELVKPADDTKINPKLRQCYDVKTKIAPFFNGDKFCVLDSERVACQCGSAVKIVSTSRIKPAVDDEDEADDENQNQMEECFEIFKTFEDEVDYILTFDVHPATGMLLTAHKSSLLKLWSIFDESKEPMAMKTMKSLHSNPIIHLKFGDPEGIQSIQKSGEEELTQAEQLKWATVAGATVRIWEMNGNRVSKAINVDNIATIGFVRWHPGSMNRLFVAESKIYVIDYVEESKQYELRHVCEGHFSQVTGIEFISKDIIVSGGRDNVLIMWDSNTLTKHRTIEFPSSIEALLATSSTDLYAVLSPSEIRHYDVATHKLSSGSLVNLGKDELVVSLQPEKNTGKFWASTVGSSLYKLGQSANEGKTVGTSALVIEKQFVGSLEEVLAVAIWNSMKVAVANNTSIIRVYNLGSGSCKFLRGHSDIVLALGVQKEWLVSGSKDNQIKLWSEDSDAPKFTLSGHIASVTAVCFDPTQMLIYSASEDTFLKVWDQHKCLQSCVAHNKEIHSVHTSPNGAMLVTSSRDKTAKVWDSGSLSLLGTLKGHKKGVWDAKFSEWDQLIATASADATVKIWGLPSFDCIKTLQGHSSSVLKVQFINSGLQILSSSSDGTMRSWDVRNSECIGTFEIADDKLWGLDSVPDGSLVVVGSGDSILSVMVDVTEERFKETVEKKNQRLEDDQRLQNFLRRGEWRHAIELALELDRPFTLLKVIRDIPDVTGLEFLISMLEPAQKKQLLGYVQKWNTSGRTSTEAQMLLKILLSSSSDADISSTEQQALIAYTQKHYNRVQRNLQNIALIKYLAES